MPGRKAAGQEDRAFHGLDDLPAAVPVMGAAGTAEFLDFECRVPGIEQQRVDAAGDPPGLLDGGIAGDMHHLDDADVRQFPAQVLIDVLADGIDKLHGIGAAAADMLDDRRRIPVRLVSRNVPMNFGTVAAIADIRSSGMTPGTARHLRDEAERRCAMGDRQLRLGNRSDAANLDAGHHAGATLLPISRQGGIAELPRR